MIHYLKNKEIDYTKWDACITSAHNRLIYGFSWYLDIVCDDWDALVLGDYEAVFPLPKRKKWGVSYIYQPFFCQQLGVFSNKKNLDVDVFLEAIPKYFKYVELNICAESKFKVKSNVNHLLSLKKGIAFIQEKYSSSHKKGIRKAQKKGIKITTEPVKEFMQIKRVLAANHMGADSLNLLCELMSKTIRRGSGEIFSAILDGKVIASIFLLLDVDRIILLSSYSTEEGRKKKAYFLLLDHVFGQYQNSSFIFDFEGSNLKGVAEVNEGFGATKTIYSTIKINRLPFFLRWLKS